MTGMNERRVYTFSLREHFIVRLADVVQKEFLAAGMKLSRMAFVFGGKRPGYFLKRELSRRIGRAFFPPHCFSWEQFVNSLALEREPRPLLDDLDACFALFQAAREIAPEMIRGRETFSQFLPWAGEIVSFLEQLDREQVADVDIQNIQQAAAIGYDVPDSINRLLQQITSLRGRMNAYIDAHGRDTTGRRFRRARESLTQGEGLRDVDAVFFCNFFYLHRSEQQLIEAVLDTGKGVLVFQGDERNWPVLAETGRALGVAIRPDADAAAVASECELKLYEGLDTHSQAGIAARLMREDPRTPSSVIVVPEPRTLVPLLTELDVAYEDCNVSMGYPLQRSALYNLYASMADAQLSRREREYYVKDYMRVLSHPFVKNLRGAEDDASLTRIAVHKVEELLRGSIPSRLAGSLFVRPEDIESSDELYAAITELMPQLSPARERISETLVRIHDVTLRQWERVGCLGDAARTGAAVLSLLEEKSFLREYPLDIQAARRIYAVLDELNVSACAYEPFPAEEVFKIFARRLSGEKIAFSGTPLQGLQVLGVIETRSLNFDRVIICDANEGVLPHISIYEPLIPREVMLRLGLHRLEKEEEIQRYHMMRLLAGSRQAHLIYNASEDKERSRFIEALVWQGQQREKSLAFAEPVRAGFAIRTLPPKRHAEKTSRMIAFMREMTFSASRLDVYLRCPLRFYFQYVLGLREQDEIGADPEGADIGTFVHELLEEAYQPLLGRPLAVTPAFRRQFRDAFTQRFAEFSGRRMKSDAFLLETVLAFRLEAFLAAEESRSGVEIIGLEQQFNGELQLGQENISVTARIDRIERLHGHDILIIDYKTGSHDAKPKRLATLAAMDMTSRQSIKSAMVSFQLPLYQIVVERHYPGQNVDAALYMLREASLSRFPQAKTAQERKKIRMLCQDALQAIIAEIMNPEVDFGADESQAGYCAICPFVNMCR